MASIVCLAALGCKDIFSQVFSYCGPSHPRTPLNQNQVVLIHLMSALYCLFRKLHKKMPPRGHPIVLSYQKTDFPLNDSSIIFS